MMRLVRPSLVTLITVFVAACNSEQPGNVPVGSGGTANPSGGNTAQPGSGGAQQSIVTGGATATANGGTNNPAGGSGPTGGATINATGGGLGKGGSTSTGGALNVGGTSMTLGGTSTGGKSSLGGANTSGASTGGKSIGGAGVGGTGTGGKSGIGGTSAGGTSVGVGGTGTGGTVSVTAIGGTHSGEATFYSPNGNGNCSYGTAVSGMDIAALNQPDYSMAAWCGACADVTGPLGTVRVLIQDRCPECKSGDLDLNPEAFDKIALHSAGRVAITWKFVSCNVTGPVRYHFKEGSSTGWVAIQVLNHRLPITSLEYSIDGGTTYKSTVRQEYNYFLEANGFGPNVVFVRITAATGQQLIDILPYASSDTTIDGEANF